MNTITRLRVVLHGAVQGVGFRPFIYRLASDAGLTGWVCNSTAGLSVEAEGERTALESFLLKMDREKPPQARIQSLEFSYLDPVGYPDFVIRPSTNGKKTTLILPDIATCQDCLAEIFDPANRRYRYPFTNCTHCGPRYSIIEALPYDRVNTSMRQFNMCGDCSSEYENPLTRRFHAQPNACPSCGPRLELWASSGKTLAKGDDALVTAAAQIKAGKIIALKGIGGFQLLVDARNEEAVRKLRNRKHREEKPFALMYPNLESIKSDCLTDALEERLLLSPEAPIVLISKKQKPLIFQLAPSIAPRNPSLGVMLPYTPLHHLLLRALEFPLVATSGNVSEEPIVIEETEALERLGMIADYFLVHNRPVVRHVDDSIVRVILGREMVLRRARGFAPLPIAIKNGRHSIMGLGAHLKNTVAQSVDNHVFMSQHIGDLGTEETLSAFKKTIETFEKLYEKPPEFLACDLHPDYQSTRFAQSSLTPSLPVQHHYAHVLSCMAENEIDGPALGVAWDGTGLGEDKTIWGGEFLLVDQGGFRRAAHLRTFMLPGAEQAVREPRRSAVGMLYELFGAGLFEMNDLSPIRSFSGTERHVLERLLQRGGMPRTSSAGRLFDGVAALLNLCLKNQFEAQAAAELEYAIGDYRTNEGYPLRIVQERSPLFDELLILDWGPLVSRMLEDVKAQVSPQIISAKFHNALIDGIAMTAKRIGEKKIVLTGGCFQNRYLLEGAVKRLSKDGFQVYWHQRIPPNDGGIALGQILGAARLLERQRVSSCV